MKLRTKLNIGFGSVLLLLLLLAGVMLEMLGNINEDVNEIVEDRYLKVKYASVIRNEVNNTRGLLLDLMVETTPALMQKNKLGVEDSINTVSETLNQLEAIISDQKARELAADLRYFNTSYNETIHQAFTLVDQGNKREASQLLLQQGAGETRNRLVQTISDLTVFQEGRMQEALDRAQEMYELSVKVISGFVLVMLIVGVTITTWVVRSISKSINKVTEVITNVAFDSPEDLSRIDVSSNDEIGEISVAFNEMAQALEEHARHEREYRFAMQHQSWIKTRLADVTTMYQGVQDIQTLAKLLITKVAPTVGASYGVFYHKQMQNDQPMMLKLAGYAADGQENGAQGFRYGEGLVGQAAAENRQIELSGTPDTYIKIASGLGEARPASILILPVEHEGQVLAVVELASFAPFTDPHRQLLDQVVSTLGVTLNSIAGHMKVERLLKESQALTEELQSQSEELQLQQEELRSINEQLEEQNKHSEQKTKELEHTKSALEEKARQVLLSSKYKSEFLANMSHELRTPLNSLLILAQMLGENSNGNLTAKQVEFANTIYSSGHDLMLLINDILDLSKVESGKMDVHPHEMLLAELKEHVEAQFLPVAKQRGLAFTVNLHPHLPPTIHTDEQRLQQILKNLLSNAFKFTHHGSVRFDVSVASPDMIVGHEPLQSADVVLAMSVTDTGIGIPVDKQPIIFEAFRQADGTTSRKYGGTGLGLSISREIAQLLGGQITLTSVEGRGSTFTLYLPGSYSKPNPAPVNELEAAVQLFEQEELVTAVELPEQEEQQETAPEETAVNAPSTKLAGKRVLVVDDDMRNVFALTTALESYDMQVLFAENGREGIEMLEEHPDIELVLMDIMMPEMDGYEAMRIIRRNSAFENLPIIALTAKAMKNDREKCIEAGASDYISKPVNLEQLFSLLRVWLYHDKR